MTLRSSLGVAEPGQCAASDDAKDTTRWERVSEDLEFLVTCGGLTDGEALAKRLGFTGAGTLERFLYRHEIPVTWKPPRADGVKVKPMRKPTERNDSAYRNTDDEIARANACVHRQLQDEPSSVPDVLAMLGLPTEQQLTQVG